MNYRTSICAAALCAPFALATGAAAQGWNWSYGADMTSDYIESGVSKSDGFAIQPWVEVENSGFYLGAWGSNVDLGTDDKWQYDLYTGYRSNVGQNFAYDLGLVRKSYDDTGYDRSEAAVGLTYTFDNAMYVKGYAAYDWTNKNYNRYAQVGYDIGDRWRTSARYGVDDGAESEYYWDVGAEYAFTDNISFDMRYHGRDGNDEGVVGMLKFAF